MDHQAAMEFTPVTALIGGALIGLSAVMLMALLGKVAGISGIASRVLPPWDGEDTPWRIAFVAGLVLAPVLIGAAQGVPVPSVPNPDLAIMGAAGLLVGFGSVYGNGCTSGHGVCGLSRLSPRSLVAVPVFMAVAGIVTYVMRHVV